MSRLRLINYNRTSISAKAIARFRRGKNRIRPDGNFRGREGDVIINWGFRGTINPEVVGGAGLLNLPSAIHLASNKIMCLQKLEANDVPTLEFYTDRDELIEAMGQDEFEEKVYCRTLISSHSGRGIEIATNKDELVDSELYTVDFPNDREYRVHIFNEKIIDIQQKRRMSSERRERLGIGEVRDDVRNLKNGWSFVHGNVIFKKDDGNYIEDLYNVPLQAINTLGLHFGAIDLLYNSEDDEVVVCEINTSPGQKIGTTTNYRYIKAIEEFMGNNISIDDYNRRWNSNIEEHNNEFTDFLGHFN